MIFLNNLFLFSLFYVFNVNEHLAVLFVKLARVGSHVSHLLFLLFPLGYLSEQSHSRTGFMFFLFWWKSSLLLFILLSVCLYGWSNSNVPFNHLTIRTVSGDHMFNIDSMNGGPWSTVLPEELNWRGTSDPSSYHDQEWYLKWLAEWSLIKKEDNISRN